MPLSGSWVRFRSVPKLLPLAAEPLLPAEMEAIISLSRILS